MRLVYRQLLLQMLQDKIFLLLLFILMVFPSLSFFFPMFSIDSNMELLNELTILSENQQLFRIALRSNTFLAYNFYFTFIGLTSLVLVMYFYRFFRSNRKQIGCIKALGFQNRSLQTYFITVTVCFALVGTLAGMAGGYLLSDILMNAYEKTYLVTDLVKGIGSVSFIVGMTVSTVCYCIVALLCYGFIRNKEAGELMAANEQKNTVPVTLKLADAISKIVPRQQRLSVRIALRKPLSVLLLFIAVMSFSVCFILAHSLNISSEKVFNAQTMGHHYEYNIHYANDQTIQAPKHTMTYLECEAAFLLGNGKVERMLTGLNQMNSLYKLQNVNGEILQIPETGTVYISPEFSEIYGVKIGDTIEVEIAEKRYALLVKEIAANAESNHIYMNGQQLCKILELPIGAYNGVFSEVSINGDTVTTKEQRIADLKRNAVSNQLSGVINQSIGALVGILLTFLALYINFQDNTHDILILHRIGHPVKSIRKMLIDVYLPILWFAFAVTLPPGIYLARAIQRSLSISTNDYMPFGFHILVAAAAFVFISLIYWFVQITFSLGIKKLIRKETM